MSNEHWVPTRAALGRHLLRHRIAGEVGTPRESNLANARRCAAGDDLYTFGLEFDRRWSFLEVLELMANRVGIRADPAYTSGPDTIDVECTLAALDAMAAVLVGVVEQRGTVLFGSGHPSGVLALHLEIAGALWARGCRLIIPAAGFSYDSQGQHRELRYLAGVACLTDGAGLLHTHSPTPMRAMLTELEEEREALPDLVVADHGYAGAAAQSGVRTVAFADSNDPALFVGATEGALEVVVPLDDNVAPHHYAPVAAYLLRDIR